MLQLNSTKSSVKFRHFPNVHPVFCFVVDVVVIAVAAADADSLVPA